MKISVALCTYNGERYLLEQLHSFINQTLQPYEIVVCDDGSTDKTLDILHNFSKHAPFIVKIVSNENNLGVAKNFNKAISLCKGDLILPSDQDDIWDKTKISVFNRYFSENEDVLLMFSDMCIMTDSGCITNRTIWGDLYFSRRMQNVINSKNAFSYLLKRNLMNGAAMGFRSSLILKALPIPDCFMHDEWLGLVASLLGDIYACPQPLVHYRQHGKQEVGSASGYSERLKQAKRLMRSHYFKDKPARADAVCNLVSENVPDKLKYLKLLSGFQCHEYNVFSMHEKAVRKSYLIPLELLSGRYFKYDNGISSIIRDVLL